MTQTARAWVGFFVSPGVPAILLYLWGMREGYGDAAVAGPGLLVPFAYIGALVIGVPAYLVLQRRGKYGLGAYLALGVLIGVIVVAVMSTAEALLSRHALQYASAQFRVSVRFTVIAAIYAMISSAAFWLIAVRRS